MKVSELMAKLAALNPEAEVYVWEYSGWEPLSQILAGEFAPGTEGAERVTSWPERDAAPSDTLIVLSE
jgi:hypothetical protein